MGFVIKLWCPKSRGCCLFGLSIPFRLESHVSNFKFPTNIKTINESWNIATQKWLKFVCYERLPMFKTIGVFSLSAVWHGLEPRYIMSFFQASICVIASRCVSQHGFQIITKHVLIRLFSRRIKLRQNVRPLFQKSATLILTYNVLSCLSAKIGYDIAIGPFWMTTWTECIRFNKFDTFNRFGDWQKIRFFFNILK